MGEIGAFASDYYRKLTHGRTHFIVALYVMMFMSKVTFPVCSNIVEEHLVNMVI